MSLDVNAAVELLEKSFGESIDDIYIPSLKKEIGFKPLTVGMQKSISKMSVGFDFDLDYQLLKLSILKTLCVDDIDFENLTEIDFITMLAQLRQNNFTEPLSLIFTCINKNCQKQYNVNINIDKIISNCKDFKFKTETITKKIKSKGETIEFKFELSESTIMSNLEYLNYSKMIADNDNQIGDINNSKLLAYPIKFIKNIYINGQQITMEINNEVKIFKDLPMIDKIKFIDNLPPTVYSEGKKSVLQQVLVKYPHQRLMNIFDNVVCPHCKNEREGVITNDSFFII